MGLDRPAHSDQRGLGRGRAGGFVRRCARHPAPTIELDLFGVRSFAVANLGPLVFSVGFFALLLCNVLFLTSVWGFGIARAGVALTPGALMAAIVAPVAGRTADRFGQRAVALPGTLTFAGGALVLALTAMGAPRHATGFLPAMLLTGTGMSIAAFGSAAVARLPRERFSTGSAVNACFRQIGAVLGIALLLAVIGDARPATALPSFHHAWWMLAAAGVAAAGCAVGPRPDPGLRPAAARAGGGCLCCSRCRRCCANCHTPRARAAELPGLPVRPDHPRGAVLARLRRPQRLGTHPPPAPACLASVQPGRPGLRRGRGVPRDVHRRQRRLGNDLRQHAHHGACPGHSARPGRPPRPVRRTPHRPEHPDNALVQEGTPRP